MYRHWVSRCNVRFKPKCLHFAMNYATHSPFRAIVSPKCVRLVTFNRIVPTALGTPYIIASDNTSLAHCTSRHGDRTRSQNDQVRRSRLWYMANANSNNESIRCFCWVAYTKSTWNCLHFVSFRFAVVSSTHVLQVVLLQKVIGFIDSFFSSFLYAVSLCIYILSLLNSFLVKNGNKWIQKRIRLTA